MLERLELEKLEMSVKKLSVDLEAKAGSSISLQEVEAMFAWYEGELRRLGERLGKRFGPEAQTLFNSTLTRMAKLLDEKSGQQPQAS